MRAPRPGDSFVLGTSFPGRLLFDAPSFFRLTGLRRPLQVWSNSGTGFSASPALRENQAFRAMNARPSLAKAAARPSFGSLASACTLPARSPSSAA
jgi:hypothetical protein